MGKLKIVSDFRENIFRNFGQNVEFRIYYSAAVWPKIEETYFQ